MNGPSKLLRFILPPRIYQSCRDLYLRTLYPFALIWPNSFVCCPICHRPSKEFLECGRKHEVLREKKIIGAGRRKALCKFCHSTDRDRLVYLYMKHRLAHRPQTMSVLHIAPEPSFRNAIKSMAHVFYLTADLCQPPVDLFFDLAKAPFPNNTFDVVIANHVLEHIPNDKAAMSEIHRILKPGGWAVLQVPLSLVLEDTFEDFSVSTPEDRARIFGQSDHVRIYCPGDYKRRLESCGFSLNTRSSQQIAGWATGKLGLAKEEELYYAIKQ